jgi:hypothetical protein
MMMNDQMRVSDADREQVTARLREHFAAGRLTSDELDERISAALNARTVADLRQVMADLPEPVPAGAQPGEIPPWSGHGPRPWAGRPVFVYRRGPRLLPLALLVLFAALILPGAGFVFFGILKVLLLVWLIACVAGIFATARIRRHWRQHSRAGNRGPWGPWSS